MDAHTVHEITCHLNLGKTVSKHIFHNVVMLELADNWWQCILILCYISIEN